MLAGGLAHRMLWLSLSLLLTLSVVENGMLLILVADFGLALLLYFTVC